MEPTRVARLGRNPMNDDSKEEQAMNHSKRQHLGANVSPVFGDSEVFFCSGADPARQSPAPKARDPSEVLHGSRETSAARADSRDERHDPADPGPARPVRPRRGALLPPR